jgi:glycine cleavage system H protein
MIPHAFGEQKELPCIWVLAGVLSYRLCDRNYDCENCELYHVLHGSRHPGASAGVLDDGFADPSEAATETLIGSYICRLTAGCDLHLDRPYSPCHFWLQRTQGEQVVLGLDGHLLRLLYPVEHITVPRVGTVLKRGEPCGSIARGRVALPLCAPLAGEVKAINDVYIERLNTRGAANGGDDWLLSLKASEDPDTVPGLYRGEQTLTWYLRKIQLLKRHLREAAACAVDTAVGVTMSDGGEPNLNLEQVLGRERFETLVAEMFHLQIE